MKFVGKDGLTNGRISLNECPGLSFVGAFYYQRSPYIPLYRRQADHLNADGPNYKAGTDKGHAQAVADPGQIGLLSRLNRVGR